MSFFSRPLLSGSVILCTAISVYACNSTVPDLEFGYGDLEKADWNIGGAGGYGGENGNGVRGLTVDEFDAEFQKYEAFFRDCGAIDDGRFNWPRLDTLPATYCQLKCFNENATCEMAENILCGNQDEEWRACQASCDTFTCDNGEEILGYYQCDTFVDCADSSDEIGCQDLWYQCDAGEPVMANQRCDTQRDCADGSDEAGCSIEYFACDNNRAVPRWKLCDGAPDCVDGSDEDEGCATLVCE